MRLSPLSILLALAGVAWAPSTSAQVLFQRSDLAVAHGWIDGQPARQDLSPQQTYRDAHWRRKMLEQFPQADADQDGVLSESEAVQYHLKRARMLTPQGKELELLPETVSRWTVRVPMRDGETLPTEVYLPGGEGPWPVVLVRTSRGRIDSALDYGNELLRMGYAFVGQDLTPEGDFIDADVLGTPTGRQNLTREDRAAMNARRSRRNAGEDGFDTIEWIAQQPWCNGQIAMNGYSEASAQSKNAMAQNPPHLAGVVTSIGTLSRSSGSLRAGQGRSASPETDLRPARWSPPDETAAAARGGLGIVGVGRGALVASAGKIDMYYNDRTAWFDTATQGAIDEWMALKHNGKSTLIMGVEAHGPVSPQTRRHPAFGDCDILFPEAEQFAFLKGKEPESSGSRMYYFLMGDATDPNAPGNVWKVTETWPPPHTPTTWHLTPDGGLSTETPASDVAPLSYTYDPNDPVRTYGDHAIPQNRQGAFDQSVRKGRADILKFDSEPLTEPVEISGQPSVVLYVSTDAPDTAFIVSVVDIYPDGYEWPLRETGVMLRARDGESSGHPAVEGKVYRLSIPMVSTAVVIDKGHRIGVRVTSSSTPAFEVHPNTWDAIESYDNAKTARNSLHLSREHPSGVILPVIAPGVSRDYRASAR